MIRSLSKGLHSDDPKCDGGDDGGAAKSVSAGDRPLANHTPANDGPPDGSSDAVESFVEHVRDVVIPVTITEIEYEEGRSERVGYLKIEPGDPPMTSPDSDTVLRLLFYLTYTEEGRSLLLEYTYDRDDKAGLPQGSTRAELKAELREEFPTLDDARLEIALEAHFAAGRYVAAFKRKPDATPPGPSREEDLASTQTIYKDKLAAMLGALHDDSMGRDFSCIW